MSKARKAKPKGGILNMIKKTSRDALKQTRKKNPAKKKK